MTREGKRRGEFALIAHFFAPLARAEPGAFGLRDDAAALKPRAGRDIVVTTDAVVAGVHFLVDDPPDTIAQKALRVNLSDLAAKGAEPRAYLLTAALPPEIDNAWLKSFVSGLKRDQHRFGITLVGGDTVAIPGPLTFNIAALGDVPHGKMLRRGGAQVGDDVWVSGTIGDAALGLKLLKGEDLGFSEKQRRALIKRYRMPEPRVELGPELVGLAHACLDVSDGLIADLGHIAEVSRLGIEVQAGQVPLSPGAAAGIAAGRVSLSELLTAGDDYELAFTAPQSERGRLTILAMRSKVALTRVGRTLKGKPAVSVVAADGRPVSIARAGYTHF
jgi:thiamine-monophosphate kinase